MSLSRKISIIQSDFVSANEISLRKATVTQTTAITSGVTLNSPAGVITTVSSTLATNGNTSFSVGNSFVKADSLVLGNIVNYAGSQGAPFTRVQGVTNGSFSVAIRNVDNVNPLNGAIKFGYSIL
ncbi:MAG: hypothetical protein EBU90_04360 [Proteobacteria bacterium]|nr:hypothetical protein [Pseudomonadota bacterium]NBP15218.1 hypothetical protein [bacterium]